MYCLNFYNTVKTNKIGGKCTKTFTVKAATVLIES